MSEARDVGSTGLAKELASPSGHLCLIFDSEEQRRRIVADYVSAGLKRGEQVRYFANEASPEDVRAWLEDMGVELPDAHDEAFGVVMAERGYCPTGSFEPQKMIEGSMQRYVQAEKAGYHGVRSAGEMAWVLRGLPGSDRFLEYEALINNVAVDFPHFGMCQYDARLFDGATLFKVLQVHPLMVAQGQIVANPFYVRPEEFVGGR